MSPPPADGGVIRRSVYQNSNTLVEVLIKSKEPRGGGARGRRPASESGRQVLESRRPASESGWPAAVPVRRDGRPLTALPLRPRTGRPLPPTWRVVPEREDAGARSAEERKPREPRQPPRAAPPPPPPPPPPAPAPPARGQQVAAQDGRQAREGQPQRDGRDDGHGTAEEFNSWMSTLGKLVQDIKKRPAIAHLRPLLSRLEDTVRHPPVLHPPDDDQLTARLEEIQQENDELSRKFQTLSAAMREYQATYIRPVQGAAPAPALAAGRETAPTRDHTTAPTSAAASSQGAPSGLSSAGFGAPGVAGQGAPSGQSSAGFGTAGQGAPSGQSSAGFGAPGVAGQGVPSGLSSAGFGAAGATGQGAPSGPSSAAFRATGTVGQGAPFSQSFAGFGAAGVAGQGVPSGQSSGGLGPNGAAEQGVVPGEGPASHAEMVAELTGLRYQLAKFKKYAKELKKTKENLLSTLQAQEEKHAAEMKELKLEHENQIAQVLTHVTSETEMLGNFTADTEAVQRNLLLRAEENVQLRRAVAERDAEIERLAALNQMLHDIVQSQLASLEMPSLSELLTKLSRPGPAAAAAAPGPAGDARPPPPPPPPLSSLPSLDVTEPLPPRPFPRERPELSLCSASETAASWRGRADGRAAEGGSGRGSRGSGGAATADGEPAAAAAAAVAAAEQGGSERVLDGLRQAATRPGVRSEVGSGQPAGDGSSERVAHNNDQRVPASAKDGQISDRPAQRENHQPQGDSAAVAAGQRLLSEEPAGVGGGGGGDGFQPTRGGGPQPGAGQDLGAGTGPRGVQDSDWLAGDEFQRSLARLSERLSGLQGEVNRAAQTVYP